MPNWYLPVIIQANAASVSSTRSDARQRRRDFDAKVAARAGVFYTLVLDDTDLLG